MSVILVTGAKGFIGGGVCAFLSQSRFVRAVVRQSAGCAGIAATEEVHGDLSASFDWTANLKGVSAIVHCAARVHVLKESSPNPLAEFRAINVDGSMNLARQAVSAGVRRFIFLSSIAVNGVETQSRPFRPDDIPSPDSGYAMSKLEAEQQLLALAGRTAMEVVIIRPPLVYGVGAPGNFSSLVKWIGKGMPLPLGAITRNSRSFIYLQNLVDLIEVCVDHPAAANQVFLASDGEDLSTTDFVKRIGNVLGKSPRLIPVPAWLLYGALACIGKAQTAKSLCRSLQIDIQQTQEKLGWQPAVSVDEGLRKCVVAS